MKGALLFLPNITAFVQKRRKSMHFISKKKTRSGFALEISPEFRTFVAAPHFNGHFYFIHRLIRRKTVEIMKNSMIFCLALCLMFPFSRVRCQSDTHSTVIGQITVAPSLVKFAGQMGFKYNEVLEKAKKGDIDAIKAMMEFHGTADGVDGLNHAQTCLELIPVASDLRVSQACRNLKPKLKELLIERFNLAQSRTQIADLKKPLKDWAPQTWGALNNQLVACPECEASKQMAKEYSKNPDGTVSNINPPTAQQAAKTTGDPNMRKPGANGSDSSPASNTISAPGTKAPAPIKSDGGQ